MSGLRGAAGALSSALDGDTGVLPRVGRPAPHLSLVRTPPVAPAVAPAVPPADHAVPPADHAADLAADPAADLAVIEPVAEESGAAEVGGASDAGAEVRPGRLARLLSRPPRRRASLLLAALVAGGLIAWVPGGPGPSHSADASDGYDVGYAIGSDLASDAGLDGGLDDEDARQGITAAEARRRLDDLAASRAARTPLTVLPTQGHMSTCFCMRWGQMHWGLDLAAPLGTPILAATDGVVLRAGPASGFGNAVYVQDTDGNVEIYGHMRYYSVHAGDVVRAGEPIAKVGSEGQSTGPHLHFEIRLGSATGKRVDPQRWLEDRGVPVAG